MTNMLDIKQKKAFLWRVYLTYASKELTDINSHIVQAEKHTIYNIGYN